jgi:hypothetical protein
MVDTLRVHGGVGQVGQIGQLHSITTVVEYGSHLQID